MAWVTNQLADKRPALFLDVDGAWTPRCLVPVYVGDDETDEDVFQILRGRGIGVLVADRPQSNMATYRLANPAQVGALLRHLVE